MQKLKTFSQAHKLHIILLIIITALVFINALGNGFVWDDNSLTVPNEAYQRFDLKKIFLSFFFLNSLGKHSGG